MNTSLYGTLSSLSSPSLQNLLSDIIPQGLTMPTLLAVDSPHNSQYSPISYLLTSFDTH